MNLHATMRRSLLVATPLWFILLLAAACDATAAAADLGSTAPTSRWWTLSCDQGRPANGPKPCACLLTVRLRGTIDRLRLRMVQDALRRRDDAQRTLRRAVRLHVELDSRGGQVFAAMEIGRLLRREAVSSSVAKGASCVSACVFVLMGAPERSVADGAHIGIHRPALGDAASDTLVDAMAAPMVSYAQQMHASPAIVADMMAIPADHMRFLTIAELAGYGIHVDAREHRASDGHRPRPGREAVDEVGQPFPSRTCGHEQAAGALPPAESPRSATH